MKTSVYKNAYSWVAETSATIGSDTELRISTRKTSSGMIVSSATRYIVQGDMISYMPFSDFSKHYIRSSKRCTQKQSQGNMKKCSN
jgi:hypothetical protein